MYYPAMLDLSKFKIVVIGGGKVAYRKVVGLLDCGALSIKIVSLTFDEAFRKLGTYKPESKLEMISKGYEIEDLRGGQLIIAATSNKTCNDAIGEYALEKGILCNVITNQKLSSFIVPSRVQRGDLTIAVSTSGSSPVLAREIKKELLEKYDESYIEYMILLGKLRVEIKEKIGDEKKRSMLLKELTTLSREELRKYKVE